MKSNAVVDWDVKLNEFESVRFQNWVYRYFDLYGRNFPWRENRDPYRVLVSEVMLQQTQTDRVVPKYLEFLSAFPSVEDLAAAPLSQVLKHWQGLGYNRRGQYLHQAAQQIVAQHRSQVPTHLDDLLELPGIGQYTAHAILTFAYNQPHPVIETNIRAVYLYHFFVNQPKVSDSQLLPLIERTLDQANPYRWFSALMDYGAFLKKTLPNPSRGSKHHVKQSQFSGSRRQLRGHVLRQLSLHETASLAQLIETAPPSVHQIEHVLEDLTSEGLIVEDKQFDRLHFRLAE